MPDLRCWLSLVALAHGSMAWAHPWHRHGSAGVPVTPTGDWHQVMAAFPLWISALVLAGFGRAKTAMLAATAGTGIVLLGCGGRLAVEEKSPVEPLIARHFKPFAPKVGVDWDGRYLLVSSSGLPDHPMMVGIRAWQQQVPLPQPYEGANAWRIPLHPVKADKPVSARNALYRGAIALAVNGVPIFNALNNRGEDAFLAGELDEYGGHCGRGDDYHYHIAPVHLQKIVGPGNPIAYALDGYPIYGYTDSDGAEPADLDEFNGREGPEGYRYHATRTYPYINGGMRGRVTVRGDQVEPQPRDNPLRPPGRPLPGALVTGFKGDPAGGECELTYTLGGQTHALRYGSDGGDRWIFTHIDPSGRETRKSFKRR